MVLKKERELTETVVGKDIMRENVKADLRSRGQTKDFNRERHLSRLYSKRNSLRMGLI